MEAHTASPKALRQTPATKQTRAAAERENGSSGVHSQSVQNAESSVLAGIEPALPLRAGQSSDSPQRGIDLSVSFSPSQGRAAGGQSSPQRTAMSRESNSNRDRTEQGQRTAMASTYAHMHLPHARQHQGCTGCSSSVSSSINSSGARSHCRRRGSMCWLVPSAQKKS